MLVVLGCGNPNRSDDGVGPAVIRTLTERNAAARSPNIHLIDAGTDGMAAMFAARGCQTLIIIDASRSGSEPGAIFNVPGNELERSYTPALNLHDFRWDHALYAGRKIYGTNFPTDVTVFLIEAATVDFGIGLSPSVSIAATLVVERVEILIHQHLQACLS